MRGPTHAHVDATLLYLVEPSLDLGAGELAPSAVPRLGEAQPGFPHVARGDIVMQLNDADNQRYYSERDEGGAMVKDTKKKKKVSGE